MIAKAKKIYQSVVTVITICLFIITMYVLIAGAISIKNGRMMNLFGFTYSIVPTNSMEPEINVGDSVIGKKEKFENLEIGDDVIYHYVYEDLDIYVVHRIIRYDEGLGYKTQGINTSQEDPIYVTKDNYISTRVWNGNLANIGEIVLNNRGTLFLVLIGILLLIAANGVFDILKILDEKKKLSLEDEKEKLKTDYEQEKHSIYASALAKHRHESTD